MADLATLTLDPNLIKPIIEAKINAAVLEAMKGHETIVNNMVHRALYHKVNSDGQVDTYGSRESKPFIEWLTNNAIREACIEAFKEYVVTCKPAMQKAIEAELRKSTVPIAKALVNGLVETSAKSWKYSVTVNPAV